MRTQRSGIPLTFVVRVSRDRDGRLPGIVERVKTGEKRRFQDSDDIGNLIAQGWYNVSGGMTAWLKAGYPVAKPLSAPQYR